MLCNLANQIAQKCNSTKLHDKIHNAQNLVDDLYIAYPFCVSEGIWDLGEGEFASSVDLHKETTSIILGFTLLVGKLLSKIFNEKQRKQPKKKKYPA